MVKVFPLKDIYVAKFSEMFKDYYSELGCDDDTAHLIDEYIVPDVKDGLVKAHLISENDIVCGFCLYQIDCPRNEWNFKEGWGDLREIYIAPEKRRRGLGKFLLLTAEMKLKESGAQNFYALAQGEAADFFAACGYEMTGEVCKELECNVFAKSAKQSGCCGCN